MPENQIRLVNTAFDSEVIYYLEEQVAGQVDLARIHNRLIKCNRSIYCTDPTAFLRGSILASLTPVKLEVEKFANGDVKRVWDYHTPIGITNRNFTGPMQLGIRNFCTAIEKTLPKDYEFHQLDICISRTAQKGKFGNIEIKYRPKNSQFDPGDNPDKMIVVNLHLCKPPGTISLITDTLINEVKQFLKDAKSGFQFANLDQDFQHNGFIPKHRITLQNLQRYSDAAPAREAHALHQMRFAGVLLQLKAAIPEAVAPAATL